LKEKNELWGVVLGKMVLANLNKTTIPMPDFTFRSNDIISHTIVVWNDEWSKDKDPEDLSEYW